MTEIEMNECPIGTVVSSGYTNWRKIYVEPTPYWKKPYGWEPIGGAPRARVRQAFLNPSLFTIAFYPPTKSDIPAEAHNPHERTEG